MKGVLYGIVLVVLAVMFCQLRAMEEQQDRHPHLAGSLPDPDELRWEAQEAPLWPLCASAPPSIIDPHHSCPHCRDLPAWASSPEPRRDLLERLTYACCLLTCSAICCSRDHDTQKCASVAHEACCCCCICHVCGCCRGE